MKEYSREVRGLVFQTQGFPFQMKQKVNGLLQAETICACSSHFRATGANFHCKAYVACN